MMETITAPAPPKHQFNEDRIEEIRAGFLSKLKFRVMLFFQLPMGFKTRMWIKELNRETCKVVVPYNRRNKNPFKSTFWAILGMAAEMSSGAFIMMYSWKQKPSVATIVQRTTAEFHKKAVGNTTFVCNTGKLMEEGFRKTIATGEPVEVLMPMTGYNDAGEVVAEFTFTWSLKKRSRQ